MQPTEQPIFEIVHLEGALILPDMALLDHMSGRRQLANPKLAQIKETVLGEAAGLIEPAAVWARVETEYFSCITGKPAGSFSGIESVLGVVCTIGEKMEIQAHKSFASQEYSRGYFLDLTGTIAVARLAQKIAEDLRGKYGAIHWAPGDDPGDLALDAQRLLFELVPAHRIGVRLTEQNVMVPVKSLSFFLIIGALVTGLRCSIPCAQCAWNGMCDKQLQRTTGNSPA